MFVFSKHLTLPLDSENTSAACPPKKKGVLEPRASADNCAKNLFSSPGTKRSFTRHPSLIKLAKSIQDDRRKINSAPSSPVKSKQKRISSFKKKKKVPSPANYYKWFLFFLNLLFCLQVIPQWTVTSQTKWPSSLLFVRLNLTRSQRKFSSI